MRVKKLRRGELIKEVNKYLVNIIKLCDGPTYRKEHIRQVASGACSLLYLQK